MCKFATFEETVSLIYRQLGKPKDSYNKLQQTGVSFLGGYIAGVACAVVSHPADVMVSKLNSERKGKFSCFPASKDTAPKQNLTGISQLVNLQDRQ